MAQIANVTIINNSDLFRDALSEQVQVAMESVGLAAEGHAIMRCPTDTGRLKNSISHAVQENTAYIGTNVEYAPYVEYGTGIHAESGGRQTPWRYQDDKGVWHTTVGQYPQPYLRPAMTENVGEYERIIEAVLKG